MTGGAWEVPTPRCCVTGRHPQGSHSCILLLPEGVLGANRYGAHRPVQHSCARVKHHKAGPPVTRKGRWRCLGLSIILTLHLHQQRTELPSPAHNKYPYGTASQVEKCSETKALTRHGKRGSSLCYRPPAQPGTDFWASSLASLPVCLSTCLLGQELAFLMCLCKPLWQDGCTPVLASGSLSHLWAALREEGTVLSKHWACGTSASVWGGTSPASSQQGGLWMLFLSMCRSSGVKNTVSGTTREIPLSGNALQNSHLSIKSSLQDWHGRAEKHQQQHCWKLACPAPMTILAWHPAQKHHCFIPPNQKSV